MNTYLLYILNLSKNMFGEAYDVAQQLKLLPAKTGNLSLIRMTHTVEGEKTPEIYCVTSMYVSWCTYMHTYTN